MNIPTYDALAAENVQLRRRISDLLWHPAFGCHRRPVLDEAWPHINHSINALIYFDLDGLTVLNYTHGSDVVDARIAAALADLRPHLRCDDLLVVIKGGDEFALVVRALDAPGAAARVQALLHDHGLSASFAIVATVPDLHACLRRAEALIRAARGGARGEGQRGLLTCDIPLEVLHADGA